MRLSEAQVCGYLAGACLAGSAVGIAIAPGAAGSANVVLDDLSVERALSGIVVTDRSKVLVRRSTVAGRIAATWSSTVKGCFNTLCNQASI